MHVNIIEAVIAGTREARGPLHVGEAMSLWAYSIGVEESHAICLLLVNHTRDTGLKETIEHFIDDVEETQIKRIRQVLREEGIVVPPATGEKPPADESQIPAGAKFTDAEIANLLIVKLTGLLHFAHNGLTNSVREDIGALFMQFYTQLVTQGITLKRTAQSRGWFRMPPAYHAGQAPQH